VKLEILREGKNVAVEVELGAMPDEDGAAIGQNKAPQGGALEGLVLEELTPQTRRAFEIPSELQQGVVVVKMDPRSPAARAGLRPGDVILEVNRSPVTGTDSIKELYAKSKSNVLLLVNRRGHTVFVVVRS
jgi:serine protease Do